MLVFILATAVALGPAMAEDLTVVSRVTPSKGSPVTSTQYITTDKVRTSDGRHDTIFDIQSGRMIHVDHKKKQYYETSMEELGAAMAEVEELLRSTPMLGQMLGQATEVKVRKGSGTGSYAGHSCQQVFMTLGEKMEFELCTAADLEVPMQYYDARKMVYAAMGPIASRFDKMFEEMKQLEGFALMVKIDTRVMGFDAGSVSEATEVRRGPIAPDAFEPPAGYKKKKSPYQQKKKK